MKFIDNKRMDDLEEIPKKFHDDKQDDIGVNIYKVRQGEHGISADSWR